MTMHVYRIDWRALARKAHEAWCEGSQLLDAMAAIGAALNEEPDCPAIHASRPHASCSLPKGHDGNHRWPKGDDCPHDDVRLGQSGWPICTRCGRWQPKGRMPRTSTAQTQTDTKGEGQ